MTRLRSGLVDLDISGDVKKVDRDNTVGLISTNDPERFPKSLLVDPERLERALIAVREEFDSPSGINIALVREGKDDDDPGLALYPDDHRDRAVVIAPRLRPGDDSTPEPGELQAVETDGGDGS
jgi:hypothetical protein